MNINLNKKIIEKQCGRVSVKSGESLKRSNKITFRDYREDGCDAVVHSTEDFQVSIKADLDGAFSASCSCPKLVSFKQECQHVAAVLLSILDYRSSGTVPSAAEDSVDVPNPALTDGLLTAFNKRSAQASGEQLYFERRTVLSAIFQCLPFRTENDELLVRMEMKVESISVPSIREFLSRFRDGAAIRLSDDLLYEPASHCFSRETDAVLQQLIKVVQNEQSLPIPQEPLLLSPLSWASLLPALMEAPAVEIQQNGRMYELEVSKERLPLRFDFYEKGRGYVLKADGLNGVMYFKPYNAVLHQGVLFQLDSENFGRLMELKRVLDASGAESLSIPPEQIGVYLEKVVPGLRKLGEVFISDTLSKRMADSSFTAKLYLDRVKNRLLAGLEFHYGNIVFNPLDSKEVQALTSLIRDTDKEDVILKLMEESSFGRTDGGYFLQNELLEYEFLYHVLPKLERFAQVHATTAVRMRIFKESKPPRIDVRANRERTNWLEFKFELTGINEKEIRDVLLALDEKRKYYRLKSGALLSLETREYKEIQRFLKALPIQEEEWEKELEVPYVKGLQLLDAVDENTVFEFKNTITGLLVPNELEAKVPEQLETVLRDYQKTGYKWLKAIARNGFGGILADDMGLGKTLQSIAFILSELPHIRSTKKQVLIVSPSSLLYNWKHELDTFAPEIKAAIMDGSKLERMARYRKEAADVVITSYPLLRKDIQEYEKERFHTVFFDEAQAFKNPLTQTAKAVRKIAADHRFALTGTPVENAREELWSIFHTVFPELFMGLKEYSNLTKKQIARRIRPFMLRRMKEDVLSELPEKMESMEMTELLPEQKKLYAAYLAKLRHDTLKHLNKDTLQKNRIRILAGLTRLRQICLHPALFVSQYSGGSAKFELLLQIIEEAQGSGRRVLIFSQFTKMLELIGRTLAVQGRPYFYLDGQTPSDERVETARRFNAGERDLFLISLKAGGTGLNLTGADTVIHYDTWWNPAVEDQASDRAHRMGQTNPVNVIKLVTRGTIEEKMNDLQERKKKLIKEIIDFDEKMPMALTEEDIRDLLKV
ncbi:SNF2 helicase associated domain-containing protein [Metabacillus sp. 113a]|uniref:DEAD/DEAH box helicase n=1 Tax=Metabacillus sp. 113a TaxID=3404706 RepID=UPI003CF0F439